jgi:DnaJ-class molecular chaperone
MIKDYYSILGVPENATREQIRSAFRNLAFRSHPDKNPGNEKAAEARFKEINEAFGVLGNENKRRQYDTALKGGYTYNPGQGGFSYSQQDIFRSIFDDPAMAGEMNRVFANSGLRFDPEFLSRVFFSGQGFTYHAYTSPGAGGTITPVKKPGLLERAVTRAGKFVIGRVFGVRFPEDRRRLDRTRKVRMSPAEAARGGERPVSCRQNGRKKKLMVTIPAGVRTGTQIRLKGMGEKKDNASGDLYLEVIVR